MQKITTFLWFNDNAEEAVNFYVSLFKNSKIISITRYPNEMPQKGKVLTAVFTLDGQEFMALDGGPMYKFSEATSMYVNCETQEEVDRLWAKLSEGGQEEQCGWLKDKYGLSWQIIPQKLGKLISDSDPEKSGRTMQAMLKMKKIDVTELQKAHDGQ
jgi:predicted 3-demethylubiquinone-9 3-methyltransferase (glyoxalase superfamily)